MEKYKSFKTKNIDDIIKQNKDSYQLLTKGLIININKNLK